VGAWLRNRIPDRNIIIVLAVFLMLLGESRAKHYKYPEKQRYKYNASHYFFPFPSIEKDLHHQRHATDKGPGDYRLLR
jgi:hypothetical protein